MSILEDPSVAKFRNAVRAYCAHVESRHSMSPTEWLFGVHSFLVELYASALRLPSIEPDTEDANPISRAYEDWKRMHDDFGRAFDLWNFYSMKFDPYDLEEEKPSFGSLADDFADIYADVRRGETHELERGDAYPNDVVWEWRFTFESHWAMHAAGALYALTTLRFVQYSSAIPESFGTWIGASAT